jgi:energy-coupling factor transporter transmembrane protein EcfT
VASVGPFRFSRGDYPARRFHPLSKLVSLLALSLAATQAQAAWLALPAAAGVAALAAAGAFSQGLLAGSRILARDARFLIPLGLFIAVFRVFDPWGPRLFEPSGLLPAALYVARLAMVFAFAEAYFRSTSADELSASATGLARRIFRRDDLDPGLYLSLAVSFIPRCFDAWERAREAALARGYGGRRGHRPRFRASLALLESFIAGSIRSALSTSEALETRGYSPGRTLPDMPFGKADLALASGAAVVAAVAMVF